MPTGPGVYIYKDPADRTLYIGKAKNLRDRVRSYFQPPIRLGPKTARLVSQIAAIDHIEVASEVEALLLESRLIKKFQPPFNIASRDDKSPYYIHLTREKFPKPVVNHDSRLALAGPFLSGHTARRILRLFRRVTPFCTASRASKRPCLYSHLGLCQPCPADPATTPADYKKNIVGLKQLFRGRFKFVLSDLNRLMKFSSKNQDFETAARLRDRIKSLDYLLQSPVRPDEYIVNPNLAADRRHEALDSLRQAFSAQPLALSSLNRIECYDVSHLSGTAATAAMTVAEDGEISPRHYRHFTIKGVAGNDVASMREVLERRFKRGDWPLPDLIVLDGGLPQLQAIKALTPIPFIALAKRQEIIYTADGRQIRLDRNHPGLQLLQRLRDEAHRFSRRLHHKHRSLKVSYNSDHAPPAPSHHRH